MGTSRRVILLEDDREFRVALEAMLVRQGHVVVGAFERCDAALASVVELRPEVALVDLSLPGTDGFTAIRRFRERLPALRVVVLSARNTPEDLIEALRAGAIGYLMKGARLLDIAGAVDAAASGASPLSPEIGVHLVRHVAPGRRALAPPVSLTAREREVLAMLVQGHAYGSIALALSIGTGTVQNHVKSIYRKLDVSSKAEATATALQYGLVDDPHDATRDTPPDGT